MASVYGDLLIYFPELFREVNYYSMTAKVGAGYTQNGDDRPIRCIMQAGSGLRLSDRVRTGSESYAAVLHHADQNQIWCEEPLEVGYYVDYKGRAYRLVEELDWALEAGFYAYSIEKVLGNDGRTETSLPIQAGEF